MSIHVPSRSRQHLWTLNGVQLGPSGSSHPVGVDSNDVGGFAELVGFGRDSFRGQGGSGSWKFSTFARGSGETIFDLSWSFGNDGPLTLNGRIFSQKCLKICKYIFVVCFNDEPESKTESKPWLWMLESAATRSSCLVCHLTLLKYTNKIAEIVTICAE